MKMTHTRVEMNSFFFNIFFFKLNIICFLRYVGYLCSFLISRFSVQSSQLCRYYNFSYTIFHFFFFFCSVGSFRSFICIFRFCGFVYLASVFSPSTPRDALHSRSACGRGKFKNKLNKILNIKYLQELKKKN